LSQRPYLPLGDLRTAIAYPAGGTAEDTPRMQQALRQVNLAHLAERLEVSCDWSHILSVGEQQRLAFARVLFNRPQVVFLDESTSAMDEGLEHALYSLLRREMPQTLLVSVGHRSTLADFHTHRLEVDGQGGWSFLEQRPEVELQV
jgi:putative ATP-binding cassette transporter